MPVKHESPGTVYFVRTVGFNLFKVGYSRGDGRFRLSVLKTACPFDLELLILFRGGLDVERHWHAMLRPLRVRREWFRYTPEIHELFREAVLTNARRRRFSLEDLDGMAVLEYFVPDNGTYPYQECAALAPPPPAEGAMMPDRRLYRVDSVACRAFAVYPSFRRTGSDKPFEGDRT